ncbi:MAG: endonuclease domain-containing protein [Candidatus Cloacimonetes bacterium]|nr:endonuclease domain-containing protein [Candidatus Cloacimonadota bacterium]
MRIYYNPKLKDLARKLRKNMTLSEVLLWNQLKQNKMKGYDFHRQKPINNYIVDFFCPKLKLIIEIDGKTHIYKGNEDVKRQQRLESLGFHFLRFKDIDVKKNIKDVLVSIENWIEECKKIRM